MHLAQLPITSCPLERLPLQWATENVELIADLFKKVQLLAFLAKEWMQIGNVEAGEQGFRQAIELAEEFHKEHPGTLNDSQIFATIAISQAEAGDFDAALATAEKISALSYKSKVYRAMANAQKTSGNLVNQGKLKKVFADAYEEFQKSPSFVFESPVEIFCNLAIAQFTIGDESAANEILAQLRQEVRDSDDHQNRPGRLATIAMTYTQVSDLNGAIVMLNEIELPEWRIETLYVIAYTQFRQKQVEAVRESFQLATLNYQEIQDEKQRAEVAGILAKIQALAGEHHQAISRAENSLEQHVELLPALANIFIDIGEAECFKQLIIPCSYYLESAYEMCQSLAQLYPEHSEEIADIVRNVN